MTLTLTANQYTVLTAICSHKDAASAQHDLGETWTDTKELADKTGMAINSVKGVLSHLARKGLVHTNEEGGARGEKVLQCLSVEGAKWLLDNAPEETETLAEEPVEDVAAEDEADVQARIQEDNEAEASAEPDGGQEAPLLGGKPTGKQMQAIAKDWTSSRKAFLELVVKAGANANSAAWHWHQGRK